MTLPCPSYLYVNVVWLVNCVLALGLGLWLGRRLWGPR